jgi:hypothetical protein
VPTVDSVSKELAIVLRSARGFLSCRRQALEFAGSSPGEQYHQDYYKKNPTKYKFYRFTCGRDARLNAVGGAKAGKP